MHPREAEAIARDAVPGNGTLHLTRLSAGLRNDTFRVERNGRSFSLRIAAIPPQGEDAARATLDRHWELLVLREAAQRNLAPPLVHGDAAQGVLVQEWLAGQPLSAAATRQPENLARVVELLRRVHGLPAPAGRTLSPAHWAAHYEAALAASGLARDEALASAGAAMLQSLASRPPPAGVVCHSDLHVMNLLDCRTPACSELKLLDWEYAHVSEPFWDLAGWSANNDFSEALTRALLCGYLARTPGQQELTRCKLLIWIYDYIALLWSRLYLHARGAAAAAGTAERAEALQERLTGSLPALHGARIGDS